jgi:predicted nucleic acid-binding protein
MGTYFLDSSAIAKRYVSEQGHTWIVALPDPRQAHNIYISQTALVEVVAAICRRAREQSITIAERDMLIDTFRQDSQSIYSIWPVTTAIYTSAGNLCRIHRLRAYDAVQLACALDVRDDVIAKQAPEPIFVCADIDLINITTTEGLAVENPNNYP